MLLIEALEVITFQGLFLVMLITEGKDLSWA